MDIREKIGLVVFKGWRWMVDMYCMGFVLVMFCWDCIICSFELL